MRKNYGMENHVKFTIKDIEILFQDDDFLIVNKPAGLVVHKTLDKNRVNLHQLVSELIKNDEVTLHHRLDKETSGAILFSKTKRVNKFIQEIFFNHSVQKKYFAITHGEWRDESGIMEDFLKKVKKNNLELMEKVNTGGQKTITEFKKIATKNQLSLMEFSLKTGRMHQVRVQSALRNYPLLGDSFYGNKKLDQEKNADRLYLHSHKISFEFENKIVEGIAKIPNEFELRMK